MNISVILTQMVKLFLMILLGTVLAKIGILDVHTKQKLTKLLLYVTTPLMIIDAFYDRLLMVETQADTQELGVGYLFAMSFLFYALMLILSVVLVFAIRVPKEKRRLYLFMTIFGNVGFMGFPVVTAVYGNEGLFYSAILNCAFNIIIYTFGVVLMTAGTADQGSGKNVLKTIKWKKLLLSPAVLCSAVAVLIFSCRIHLPCILTDTFDTLGGLTSPLAMLVVGANLSGMKVKEMVSDWKLDLYVLLRQIALPLVFWLAIRLFTTHPVLAPVWLLLSGMPVANTTALFATEYKGDEALASKGIFLSTLLSLASFPLIIWSCCC